MTFSQVFSQTNIGGVVNDYESIITVNNPGCSECDTNPACLNQIEVADASDFSVGDKALIVQLKGATIDQTNTANGGMIIDLGSAGNYEFFDIGSISGNLIYPETPLKNVYDSSGLLQLVRVPVYDGDVTITSELQAQPWDDVANEGGIIALFVNGTLTLNADVNAAGAGFIGVEMTTNGTPDDCSIAPNAQYNLPAGNSDSWFKGGGVAVAGPNNQKGRSPLGNGGGSGVSGDSGGGGGANYGAGGVGGNRWCDYGTAAGGIGGNGLATFIENQNKVFFGGAGGTGFVTTNNPSQASNGGGIVVLRADEIVGNGFTINASGADALAINPVGQPDGGGGGGAGGSVAFDVKSYSGTLNINISGGDGQTLNTDIVHGPGGGGGGGVFLHNLSAVPAGITIDLSAGTAGTHSGAQSTNSNGATDGSPGGIINYYTLIETINTDNNLGTDDGISDFCDLDSDNDGILDSVEDGGTGVDPSLDADGDGIPNYLDQSDPGVPAFVDANGDGVNDVYDTDGDGTPDFQDLDSDNDGCFDSIESGGTDSNNDGALDGDGFNASGQVTTGGAITDGYDGYTGNETNATQVNYTPPTNQTEVAGETVTFEVVNPTITTSNVYTGSAPNTTPDYSDPSATTVTTGFIYQWYLGDPSTTGVPLSNDATYSGVNTASLNVVTDLSQDGNQYCVVVTNTNNSCENISCASLTVLDPCDAAASGNPDNDGDNVSDECDIDNDNDGILDSIEGACYIQSDPSLDNFDLPVQPNVNDNNILTSSFNGWTTQNGSQFNIIRVDGTGYAPGPDNAHSGDQYVDIAGANDFPIREFTITEPSVISASAWFANRDTAVNPGGYTPWDARIEILDVTNTVLTQGNIISFTLATDPEEWFQSQIFDFALPNPGTYRIRVYVDDYGHFDTAEFCISTDTDADGVSDYLDLDSDNDGIYDIVEAGNGSLDTNGDGVIDSNDAIFSDGDGNGADDTAEGTTPIDTLSDGSYDFQNTDSDGDGCSDANEAYDDINADGGDGDQFGTGDPSTVNSSNGLVTETGVDYSTGTNAAVTDNSTMSACLTITANDDDFSSAPISSIVAGTTASVFGDNGNGTDLADGVAATNANISNNISISDDDGMTGVTINNNGTIVVPPNTPDGTYFVEYTICLQVDNTVCDSAIATIVVATIDPCNAVASGNLDTDGDGVSDYCDQDDDNDGILDTYDIDCAGGPIALGQTFSDATGSNFNPEYINNVYAYGGADVTFGYELQGGAAWNGGVSSQNNGAILPDGEYINTIPDGTSFPDGRTALYYFTFSEPVYNVNFKLGGLDDFDRADFEASNGVDVLPVSISDINVGANLTINGQSAITGSSANANAPSNSIQVQVSGPVTEIRVRVGKQDGSVGDVELQFYEFEYCVAIDTDGDGVNDIVDLDSDNDGIYDVDEVGGVDANNDGMADGAVGATTGIPATAGSGITPVDTLNDGSFDYQNTDSDGDGCPDANEAYGNVTAAGSDGGQFGEPDPANVDSDGLVLEGEVNYDVGTNTAVTNPLLSPACNPCDATISGNEDNDGDNVSDICDVDDDNDGILDIYELNCSSGPVALGQTFSDNTGSNFNPEFIPNLFPYNGASVTFGYELRGGVAWNSTGVSSQNNVAILPDGEYINTIPDGTDFPNGEVVNYYFTFTEPVYNVNFKVGGIDDFDRADFVATNGAQNIPVSITDINVGANLTINGQSAVTGSSANANAPFNSIQIEIQGPVTEVVVTVGKQDGSVGDVELQFYEFEYCLGLDTDGDGVDDIFDLDSDNDGIYDVDESGNGALDTNGDGILDSNDTGFNDGDGNGADDTAEATTPIDTLSDGSYDFQNTDSDGDSCPDANEAYDNPFVSGSDGGQFGEPDPASVDSNTGLVTETGVDYSTGTSAAVTNPAIATSCVINPSIVTTKAFANIDGNALTTEYSAVGEVINYTITLTNNGNVNVYNPTMADTTADVAPVRGADAPGNDDGILDVGETWTYTVSHTVTQADLDNGSYTNTAEADGSADTTNDGSGDTPVDNDDSETVNGIEDPSIEAVKTVAITNDVAPVGASLGDTV
ncbi:beta strand repeat-containing protein, partial [Winogradskyella marincola]|nr:hypothetical protein [Winogradskyella sp. YYF002]